MEGIQTTIRQTGPNDAITVIKVGGYIDTTNSSELERALASLLKKNQYRIIVDLADVDYISSAGWGIFISEIKGIKENSGDLKLVRMIPEVYEVFELLEFHYILKAYDTVDEAVADFVKEAGGQLEATASDTQQTKPAAQPQEKVEESQLDEIQVEDEVVIEDEMISASTDHSMDKSISIDEMTVDEKIMDLVSKHPEFSARQVKKVLSSAEYNFTKVGWFEAKRRLKALNLQTKENRIIYARKVKNLS